MKNVNEIIDFLRNFIQEHQEIKSKKEQDGKDTLYLLGKLSAANDILLAIGAKPELDEQLVLECEILIPKGEFWAGHELNRGLHSYRASVKDGDWVKFIQLEISLRRNLMKARWEVAKSFDKYKE